MFVLVATPIVNAQDLIVKEIVFEGNKKTRESVLRNEIVITEGDTASPESVEASRQFIQDLELFKSVETRTEDVDGGVRIVFTVREKRYWYIVPAFSRGSDGDIAYGARLQMDNLLGRANVLSIRARRKDLKDTDIQSEDSLDIEYSYPRVFSSLFDLDMRFNLNEADIEEERNGQEGQYFRDQTTIGISLARWLTSKGPSKGWRGSVGFFIDDYDHTFLGGDPTLFFDTTVQALTGKLQYIDVTNHGFYRSGQEFTYSAMLAADSLGSDESFARHTVQYKRFVPLKSRPGSNLNLRFTAGYTTDSIFGDATFRVASGRTIRGFERDSIEGNAFYYGTVEYLAPLFNRETLRGVVFFDLGKAEDDVSDLDFSNLNYSIGLGMRWKIQSFVRTDIRIDIARGLTDDGETKVFAGTRATF
ncbi:MAG: BamA/TamA family outer membrane protein [Pseudomonadota bacterium]